MKHLKKYNESNESVLQSVVSLFDDRITELQNQITDLEKDSITDVNSRHMINLQHRLNELRDMRKKMFNLL